MKKTLLLLIVAIIAVYAWVITDRDRSLWILNTAVKTLHSASVDADIEYGQQAWQKLDVYPANAGSTPSPVMVFFHGGGWYHGRKDQYFFAAEAFLRLGYTVVLPDYIKHPAAEARFPAHIVDGAKAIAWVRNNIARYNGDPDNIFISGHSAGAHTAALLATDHRYLEAEGLSVESVRGFAGLAGPYQFDPDTYQSKAVFGPESNYPLMNPLRFIDGNEPSMLIMHSDADSRVGQRHPREFEQAALQVNADVETRIYETLSHAEMVLHLHPWFGGSDTLAAEIDRFFRPRMRTDSGQEGLSN